MFRPTSFLALCGVIVFGVILADFVHNASGTTAAANGVVAIETPALNALLGQTSSGSSATGSTTTAAGA
jgi:hypothetical protein